MASSRSSEDLELQRLRTLDPSSVLEARFQCGHEAREIEDPSAQDEKLKDSHQQPKRCSSDEERCKAELEGIQRWLKDPSSSFGYDSDPEESEAPSLAEDSHPQPKRCSSDEERCKAELESIQRWLEDASSNSGYDSSPEKLEVTDNLEQEAKSLMFQDFSRHGHLCEGNPDHRRLFDCETSSLLWTRASHREGFDKGSDEGGRDREGHGGFSSRMHSLNSDVGKDTSAGCGSSSSQCAKPTLGVIGNARPPGTFHVPDTGLSEKKFIGQSGPPTTLGFEGFMERSVHEPCRDVQQPMIARADEDGSLNVGETIPGTPSMPIDSIWFLEPDGAFKALFIVKGLCTTPHGNKKLFGWSVEGLDSRNPIFECYFCTTCCRTVCAHVYKTGKKRCKGCKRCHDNDSCESTFSNLRIHILQRQGGCPGLTAPVKQMLLYLAQQGRHHDLTDLAQALDDCVAPSKWI